MEAGREGKAKASFKQMARLVEQQRRVIEEQRRIIDDLDRAAHHDPLTGARNRRGFDKVASAARASAAHPGNMLVAVDLDKFKTLNDTHGHPAGDAALVKFHQVAVSTLRSSDHVSRFGGEEFFLLLAGTDKEHAADVVAKIQGNLTADPLVFEGKEIRFTFSAGVVEWLPGEHFEEASKRADGLLYLAKETGRARSVVEGSPEEAAAKRLVEAKRAMDRAAAESAEALSCAGSVPCRKRCRMPR